MKSGYYLLLILLFSAISASAQSDSTFIGHAIGSLTKHFETQPVEKVYLHLDKPHYNLSDTIWFKAYTVVGEHHQLSALSGVLYCELINSKDSVIKRHVLKLTEGIAWGDFILSRSFKPGNYHIRAYTNWMRNAGTEYFYNQVVRIGALQPALAPETQAASVSPDVQFFPEGGELVNGVRSRVAVKSINAKGLGEDIKGTIQDNDGNEVAAFTTQHLGMGVFALIPQAGKTYKAKMTCADGSQYTIDLPKAKEEGFTLAINNRETDSIYAKVAANNKLFQAKQNATFYLVGQAGGKVYYSAEAKLTGPIFTAKIPKSRFPSGIVQFTLFSQSGEPVNERIAFIQNSSDELKIALSSSAQTYAPRQKVMIEVGAKSNDAQAVAGSFSVAVINESRVLADENKEGTILNNLLLTSDLKGYIEQPNYYFSNINDQTRSDLDVLMLTQGYRRFEWKQVLNKIDPPLIYSPEKSLELAGTLKTPSGKIVPNGKISLLATRESFVTDTMTDINGNFKFTDLALPDTAKIVLRARKANDGGNVAIYLKQADYPALIKQKARVTTDNLSPQLSLTMQKNYAEYQNQLRDDSLKNETNLKEVIVKGKRTPKQDMSNLYGTVSQFTIKGSKLVQFGNLVQGLQVTLPNVLYNNGKFVSPRPPYTPLPVVINENQVDPSEISNYNTEEIHEIKILEGAVFKTLYGVQGGGDRIIFITTKQYAGTDTAKAINLKEVTIKSNKSRKAGDLSSSSNLHGGGNADQVIMGDKISGCITLSDCLIGKVFGVNFSADGTPVNTREGGKMSVIIDGIIMDGSYLNFLNSSDIYSLEVLRSASARSIYGTSIQKGGALIITTKRIADPNYVTSEAPSGLITYPFKGFYKARAFYSPKYSGPKTDVQALDIRSTIYWNPNLVTDKDGKTSFEYFNADTKGAYRVVVEGIDDNGYLGRQVYRYKVE